MAPLNHFAERNAPGLITNLDLIGSGQTPGSVFAARLKSKSEGLRYICQSGSCKKLSNKWILIPTDLDINSPPQIVLTGPHGVWTSLKLNVEPFPKPKMASKSVAKLRLPAQVMKRIDDQKAKIESDKVRNKQVYSTFTDLLWAKDWSTPLNTPITSEFGSPRFPPKGSIYFHTGVDLRAATGTTVFSVAKGRVIAADEQVMAGNVITVDHGRGVLSRYMHLDKFLVKEGDLVEKGTSLGLSGSTGRVEAPHLHWEMRVNGKPVNPFSTLRLLAQLANSD